VTGEIVVLISLVYLFHLFALSRRRRPELLPAPDGLFVVFAIPCLNEETVIGATLDNLLTLPGDDYAVLVVDDAATDRTAEIVRGYLGGRVDLLERRLPNAQEGKGDALNAACRHLATSRLLRGRRPEDVVVAIFDADGRIERDALSAVAGYFRDPQAGAVQIGVEMRNAHANLLARMQDIEFCVFTEVFQRARQRLGSVGLGGNGQFVRLKALQSLGDDPWSDCLTEDLDLGVRLLLAGWKNNYCPTACVNQQAVTSVRLWLRQRTRWFQGHLQCWRLIPRIIRSSLSAQSSSDIVWYLTLPVAVLLVPIVGLPVLAALVVLFIAEPSRVLQILLANHGLLLLFVYLVSFGPAYVYGFVYWLRGRGGLVQSILLAHAFEVYSHLWLIAGWTALLRFLRRKRGWDKTARVAEPDPATS
jgi:cellulose synthase/poly-beta-1,6-N-acetylglucosamine synthase-like glycosyltransferase